MQSSQEHHIAKLSCPQNVNEEEGCYEKNLSGG